jgi:hypothetical protein
MKIDRRKLEEFLPKKGFKIDNSRDKYFHFYYNGKKTIAWTKVSYTKKMQDIDGWLLKKVKEELHLDTNKQAVDLCHCDMSEAQYIDVLKQKGVI